MLQTREITDLGEEASAIVMLNGCDLPVKFLQILLLIYVDYCCCQLTVKGALF